MGIHDLRPVCGRNDSGPLRVSRLHIELTVATLHQRPRSRYARTVLTVSLELAYTKAVNPVPPSFFSLAFTGGIDMPNTFENKRDTWTDGLSTIQRVSTSKHMGANECGMDLTRAEMPDARTSCPVLHCASARLAGELALHD